MRKQDDHIYLQHILDAIAAIRSFTETGERTDMVESAIERKLEIIGEAVKKLSMDIRRENPDIPWQSIAGTRDRLIHNYMGVDVEAVWAIVDKHLPDLEQRIKEILKSRKE